MTEDEIAEQAALDQVRASTLRRIRARCEMEIENAVPPYKQRNAALGLYPAAEVERIKAEIQRNRQKCAVLEHEIGRMTSVEDLQSLQWESD